MLQGRKARKILANLLIGLMLLTNPVVIPAVQAVNAAEQTAAKERQTATAQGSPTQSVTDTVYTVDKSANRQPAVQLATGFADGDGQLSNQPTTKDKAFRFGNSLLSYYLNQGKNHGPRWLKTTSLNFFVSEDFKPVYSFETIQPFGEVDGRASLWFWQGRYAHGGDASTANIGLGWRKLSADKHSMVGYNLFYDYGFQYNLARVGLGGEYFNKQAEYRFNVYHPVSGDRQTNVSYRDTGTLYSYIRAVDGLDLEMGTSLPHAQWMKWYLKGYFYDNKHNDDELGYQLRTTMQISPRFRLELGYRYSNLSHEPYATFKYQLADILSPSVKDDKKTGDNSDLSYKLLQPVERDNDIKTETYTRFVAYTGSIQVTVNNSLNSTPIVGATVQAYQNGVAAGPAVATDISGKALINGLTVGNYTVQVIYSTISATTNVTVVKDQTTAAAVNLAVRGGSTRITVLDGQSQPVSGASVTATLSGTTVAQAEKSWFDRVLGVQTAYAATALFNVTVNADANGTAEFTNLPSGTYVFTVSHNGHTIMSQGVEIATSGSNNITVILPTSGGNIQAVVKDSSGTAISGATVHVLSGTTAVATCTTDSNGVAVIGGIAAGSYTISAAKTGYTSYELPNVNVIEGQTASAIVTLTRQTGNAQITVTFSDGATNVTPSFYVDGSTTPYANVTVSTTPTSTSPGVYTLTGLTANIAHSITCSAANYSSTTATTPLTVTPTSTTPATGTVTLTRQTGNAQITVTFSDGATNVTPSFYVDGSTTPYANVTVSTTPTSTSPGVYTLTGLTANIAHSITCSAANYSSTTATTPLTVTPTSTTPATGTVTLTRQTGNAQITVTFSDGATNVTPSFYVDGSTTPYANVTVSTTPTSTSPGVYTLTGLTANIAHSITCSAANYSSTTATTPLTVTPTSTTPATGTVTLTRQTGNAQITVTFSDGATNVTPSFYVDGSTTPYANVTVSTTPTSTSPGVYTLTGLTANIAHSITCSAANYSSTTATTPLTVTPTSTTPATGTVTLTRQTGNAQITVTFSDGATNVTPSFYVDGSTTPYANVTVSTTPTSTSPGVYTLTGLTANIAHSITCSAANYSSTTATTPLTVTPTSTTPATGTVTLTRQTGNAQITVTFSDGATNVTPSFYVDGSTTPYANVTVSTTPTSTSPGVYTLTGLAANVAHSITCSAANYDSSAALSVTPSGTETVNAGSVTLTRQTGGVKITAVSQADGATLPALQMKLANTTNSSLTVTKTTDASGTATFDDLFSGQYEVTLYDTQGTAVNSSTLAVVSGNVQTNVGCSFPIVKIKTITIHNSGPGTTFAVTIANVQAATSMAVGNFTTDSIACTANIYVYYSSMPQYTVLIGDGRTYASPVPAETTRASGENPSGTFEISSNASEHILNIKMYW
ncbi:MAG TPA: carboxypeptidase regulatory-like domain-containing protein [Methylomusa anaerophila]|uniref:carboxypeptidase regulatory-like domain-containing protein n=1 Tax=Methylomusa anaerophila TaxID=1930071 RepID=UPI002C5ABA04|nr:carboxypeptidase regulatory-like domain-containing protein [Methylomusa anaerophila]HML86838.1 carboxypeptidase regulatory-like domain-containing protein [Methylomusa anaerophila]